MFMSSGSLWICWYSYFCLFPLHSNQCTCWNSVMSRRGVLNISFPQISPLAKWIGKSFMWFYSNISLCTPPGLLASWSYTNICLLKQMLMAFLLTRVDFTPNFICSQDHQSFLCLTFAFHCISSWIIYFRFPFRAGKHSVFSHPRFFCKPVLIFDWVNITSCLAEGKTVHIDYSNKLLWVSCSKVEGWETFSNTLEWIKADFLY